MLMKGPSLILMIQQNRRWLAFAGLALVIVVVYGPSLEHVARGDQVNYLAEMARRHGFAGTVLDSFDLNRTRSFAPGDTFMFRPLLYLMLGLEKYFFGYEFRLWQAAGILAHLFAVGALYAFLCRVRGGIFALAGASFFAFIPVNIEAVIWHHISAYVIFAGCVLMALRHLYAPARKESDVRADHYAAIGWMAAAVFLYEVGLWYMVAMAVFFWRQGARRAGLIAAGVVVVYALLSGLDFAWRHPDAVQEAQVLSACLGGAALARHAFLLVKWFAASGFFLGGADLVSRSRMMVDPGVTAWTWPWGHMSGFHAWLGLGLIFILAVGSLAGRIGAEVRRNAALLGLALVMALGGVLMIAAGRISVQGVSQGIIVCLYYPYNFLILLVAAAGLAAGPGRKIFGYGAAAAMILFSAVCAGEVYAVNERIARDHNPSRVFIHELGDFIRTHRQEPGFSFYVGPDYPGNYTPDWLFRRGDAPGRVYTMAEILCPQYFTTVHPKYNIVLPPS